MKKKRHQESPKHQPRQRLQEAQFEEFESIANSRDRSPIKPLNDAQSRYINAIKSSGLVFATGPAGSGKTWVCAALAAQALENREIDKIIITRPACEAGGEKLGFLPGELEEKFDPYLQPFRDVLNERLGNTFVDYLIKRRRIEAAPLGYMRGRTFKNAYVILDEAQNTTPISMKLFLTRIGENCKVIVNGDISQKDIPGESGLDDAVNRICPNVPSARHVRFTKADVVRSGLVQEIIEAYELPRAHD